MNPYNKIKTNKAQSFINEATGETSSVAKEPKKVGRPKGSVSMHKKESIINVYVTKGFFLVNNSSISDKDMMMLAMLYNSHQSLEEMNQYIQMIEG